MLESQTQELKNLESPKRTGVVLIHGLTGTPTEMKPLEKYLRKLGFDVENVLLAGHGGGHGDMLDSNWQQWVESARNGLFKILERNEQAILCGLSMGGIISARLAAEEPRVAGAMMLSPTLVYDGSITFSQNFDSLIRSRFLQRAMRGLVEQFPLVGRKIFWEETPPYGISDERIQRQITKSIESARQGGSNEFGVFRTYYGSFTEMWQLIDDTKQRFGKIKCPVVMVHSLDDTLASINNATEAYSLIGSDNKTLVFLSGCDHVMTLDLQRHKVMKLLGNFIQYIDAGICAERPVFTMLSPALQPARQDRPGSETTITLHNEPQRNARTTGNHTLTLRHNGQVKASLPIFTGTYQLARLKHKAPQPVLEPLKQWLPSVLNPQVLGIGSAAQGLTINQEQLDHKSASYLFSTIKSLAKATKAQLLPVSLTEATKAFEPSNSKNLLLQHRNPLLTKLTSGNLAYLPENELSSAGSFEEALATLG